MKVIIFDKDGVLVNTLKEIFHEAVHAYGAVKENRENLNKFHILYPIAKKAEDLYPIMEMIKENREIRNVTSLGGYDLEEAEKFKDRFYANRMRLVKNDFEKWLGMIKPFRFAINAANALLKNYDVFISTTADIFSTVKQIKIFGIRIPQENIRAKEFSTDKTDHVKLIKNRKVVGYSDIVFIDNSLEHLKAIKKLGCKVALASWDTNKRRTEEAKKIGVCVLRRTGLISQIKEMME